MAFHTRALSRYATSDRGGRNRQANAYVYSTEDDAATVQAPGYFSAALSRFALKVGDIIEATVNIAAVPARRSLLVAAISAGTVTTVLAGEAVPASIMRAMGPNTFMNVATRGIPSAQRAMMTRVRHRSHMRTDKLSIVYQLFIPAGASNKDVMLFTDIGCNFAGKFVPNPLDAFSGLPVGTPFEFSGAKFKRFDPANADPSIIEFISDPLPIGDIMGRYLEENEFFESQTCLVLDLDGNSTQGAKMPLQRPLSNFLQRYTGVSTSANDEINGGAGGFFTRTSYPNNYPVTGRTGTVTGFGPFRFMASVPKTQVAGCALGDSITQNQKVGYDQKNILYDVQGDADGNTSFAMIGARARGFPMVNHGRGSDGEKYLNDPTFWPMRKAAIVAGNYTFVDLLNGANDFTSSAQPSAWTATTAQAFGDIRRTSTQVYMAMSATGTTGSTGPVGTTPGATETDGSVTWVNLGPYEGGNARDAGYQVFAWRAKVARQIKDAYTTAGKPVPTIRCMSPFPKLGTSTDSYATTGGQTPHTANPTRTRIYELYFDTRLRVALGCDAVFSLATAIETDQNSGIVKTDGNPGCYIDTSDFVHLLDIGHREAGAIYPAAPALTTAQLAA